MDSTWIRHYLTTDCGHWIERNHLFILILAEEGVTQALIHVPGTNNVGSRSECLSWKSS
jgi:hypothetical protein